MRPEDSRTFGAAKSLLVVADRVASSGKCFIVTDATRTQAAGGARGALSLQGFSETVVIENVVCSQIESYAVGLLHKDLFGKYQTRFGLKTVG